MLKQNLSTAALVALLATPGFSAFAGQLDQTKVPADAKWVVHLDLEAFRKSTIGSQIIARFVQPNIERNDFIKNANLSINLTNISGVTAYGPNFEKDGDGVLMLTTSADVKKDMDTLVGMASLSENETKDVTMVQQSPFPLYNLKGDLFIAPIGGSTVLLAKSREGVENAREITSGKGETLAQKNPFKVYPSAPHGHFFSAMAQGFNNEANIPPQAQVLRETEGGRFLIGENDKSLFLNLVFKGKDQEATTKIQQVLQGIVALVSMSRQNNPDLIEVANSTKIASEGQNVSITLNLPVTKALDQMTKRVKLKAKENSVQLDVEAGDSGERAKDAKQEDATAGK